MPPLFLAFPLPYPFKNTLATVVCIFNRFQNKTWSPLKASALQGAKVRDEWTEWHLSSALPRFARMEGWRLDGFPLLGLWTYDLAHTVNTLEAVFQLEKVMTV